MSIKEKKTFFNDSNFTKFWIGQTISAFGSQITVMALPLTAVIMFNASPMEMGIYQGAASAPYLILVLFAGVLIDRVRKHPLLIYCNISSAILLSFVPLLAWLNLLNIWIMCIILFLSATSSLIFELAYLSFIPKLIAREKISEANSKIQGSIAMSRIVGPNIAGILISLFTAPFAILIDSFSFLISYFFLRKIKVKETVRPKKTIKNIWSEIGEGLTKIFTHPILLSLSASTAMINFFHTAFASIFMIFLVKQIQLTPIQIGIIMSIGSIGTLFGALIAKRLANYLGIGSTIIYSTVSIALGAIIMTSTPNSFWISLLVLGVGQFLSGIGNTVYVINQVSLRQIITPEHLLGRINASNHFITRGGMPIAGVFGGFIGSLLNLKIALIIISLGYLLSVICLLISPIKSIKKIEDALKQKENQEISIVKS